MPSQRAILIDLEKKKLNPAKPYKTLDSSGHLTNEKKTPGSSVKSVVPAAEVVAEKSVVAPDPIVTEPIVTIVEEAVETSEVVESVVEPIVEEVVTEENQPSKRRGRKFNTRA